MLSNGGEGAAVGDETAYHVLKTITYLKKASRKSFRLIYRRQ